MSGIALQPGADKARAAITNRKKRMAKQGPQLNEKTPLLVVSVTPALLAAARTYTNNGPCIGTTRCAAEVVLERRREEVRSERLGGRS